MATLKLRPWPFQKGEPVELYWIGSAFTDSQRAWKVKVAFKTNTNQIKYVNYSWGALPLFRLGQQYVDGVIHVASPKRGVIDQVIFANLKHAVMCKGFDIPNKLFHLYRESHLGSQYLIKLSVDQDTYYASSPL